ncbi:hypothetical protein P879_10045 [Paragonimus westermani]|uniref:Uncharacterized protein n=1 Tax=Paragonimus westermani TaxID=34504 RepID=A0A8T0DMN2_9TREM|nr:hypothetical protein P879_10045 [Paragonimus westermani]
MDTDGGIMLQLVTLRVDRKEVWPRYLVFALTIPSIRVFTITLTVMDPFFQLSPPVTLRIATFLQPVVQMGLTTSQMVRAPSFQVFSLPLFTYTGAVSLIQKHNIQVVGYIDESMIVYTVQPWSPDSFGISSEPDEPKTRTKPQPHGSLRLDGERINRLVFGPPHIAVMRVSYVHTGGYEPSIERIPLSVRVPSLSNQLRTFRVKREWGSRYLDRSEGKYGNLPNNTTTNVQPRTGRKRGRRRLRIAQPTLPELQLEISIRIVRLYNRVSSM